MKYKRFYQVQTKENCQFIKLEANYNFPIGEGKLQLQQKHPQAKVTHCNKKLIAILNLDK